LTLALGWATFTQIPLFNNAVIGKEARRFRSGLLMLKDAWNRLAVKGLLADTERIVALVDIRDIRGNRELARDTITIARQNYIDLVSPEPSVDNDRRRAPNVSRRT
jgi:hypothetical protein